MNLALLVDKVRNLPQDKQAEVIDFVDFLAARCGAAQPVLGDVGGEIGGVSWSASEFEDFSLSQAMRGLEDEPDRYDESDLTERWR